jgi:hypothetical protein
MDSVEKNKKEVLESVPQITEEQFHNPNETTEDLVFAGSSNSRDNNIIIATANDKKVRSTQS